MFSTALLTITRKEISRIFRISTQTLLPPVITQSLYFVVFGNLLGAHIGVVGGLTYAGFLVPGLVLMAVVTNAFSNVASSFFSAKFQKSIEEILVAPVSPGVIIAGFCSGGIVRSLLVGIIVFIISMFFVVPVIMHVWAIVFFGLMTALAFSLMGFLNGLFAKKFDDIGIIPTFVLTPLTYLGGVFYDINQLPGIWKIISYLNPIAYAIDGFRYGFSGTAHTPVIISAVTLTIITLVLTGIALTLVRRGVGLKT